MNLRGRRPEFQVWASAQADIDRIGAIWRECLEASGGPFLFGGQYTVADAMYAPVCTRFETYDVELDDTSAVYCAHMVALPDMIEWTRAATDEQDAVSELDAGDAQDINQHDPAMGNLGSSQPDAKKDFARR